MTSQQKQAETPIKKETELTGPVRQSSIVTSSTRHAPYSSPFANSFVKSLWGATSRQTPLKSEGSILSSSTLLDDFSAIHTRIEDTVKRLQTDNATITEENRQLREQLAGMKTAMEEVEKEKREMKERRYELNHKMLNLEMEKAAWNKKKQSMKEQSAALKKAEIALKAVREIVKGEPQANE